MATALHGQQRVARNSSVLKKSPRHPTGAKTEPEPPVGEDQPVLPRSHTTHITPSNRLHSTQTPVTVPRRSGRATQIGKKFEDIVIETLCLQMMFSV